MTENVRKLVGVVVMAVLVVVGVVATSGGDDVDFTRNAAFTKLPAAQRARLAPAFVEQTAPKANIWTTGGTSSYVPDGRNDGKVLNLNRDPIFRGKASVLEGKGVDGKGGASSIRLDTGIRGKTGKAGAEAWWYNYPLGGRKASFRAGGAVNGVADRIADCANSFEEIKVTVAGAGSGTVVNSLKNVLVTSYTDSGRITYSGNDEKGSICLPTGTSASGGQEGEALKVFPKVEMREAELLAECMESKVGDVFLKSHIKVSADECVATVMPALSPDRAIQLGTYWQTPEQLTRIGSEHCWPCD